MNRHRADVTGTAWSSSTGKASRARLGDGQRGARPRAQRELMEWLGGRSVKTLHELRRQRFTLRMIAAAERDGIVSVDLESGRVAVH